jgi:hypothetical protein
MLDFQSVIGRTVNEEGKGGENYGIPLVSLN